MHRHPNEWFARQARRVLADRAARGESLAESRRRLRELFAHDKDPSRKLRALWSLHAIGDLEPAFLVAQLNHQHEAVRSWAIRLLTDFLPIDSIFSQRIGPDAEPPDGLLALPMLQPDNGVQQGNWFTYEVIARGNKFTLKVNGKTTTEFTDPRSEFPQGHVVLQIVGSSSLAEYRKIEIRDGKIAKNVDAKLSGGHGGRKFNVGTAREVPLSDEPEP